MFCPMPRIMFCVPLSQLLFSWLMPLLSNSRGALVLKRGVLLGFMLVSACASEIVAPPAPPPTGEQMAVWTPEQRCTYHWNTPISPVLADMGGGIEEMKTML